MTKLTDVAISESGFVFNPYNAETYTVNATGLYILKSLQRGRTEEEIVSGIENAFRLHGEDVGRDVAEFIHLLQQYGLVGPDEKGANGREGRDRDGS